MGDLLTLLGGWDAAPVPLVGVLLTAALYLVGVRRVQRATPARPWPAGATAFFLGGLLTVAVAVLGPPGAYDDVFFYAHMTQHILLTMLAAPLLVLGDPLLLLLRAVTASYRRRRLVPILRSRVVHALAHPAVGWSVYVGVMVLSHIPAVYDFALRHPVVHDYVEHPLYLGSALIFYYPLLAPTSGVRHVREWVAVLSLFTVMVPMALTGFLVYAQPHLAYPFYAHVDRPFGPGPLRDQQLAGALMWSSAMLLSALWLVVGGMRWLRSEERKSRRLDLELQRVGPAEPSS